MTYAIDYVHYTSFTKKNIMVYILISSKIDLADPNDIIQVLPL